jgi:DedD protein
MSDQLDPILHQAEQSRLKQQLAWRLGIAAGLIIVVLAAIWFLDHSQNGEPEPTITTPRFASAVSAIATIKASAVASAVASAPVAASTPASAPAVASTPVPTATREPSTPEPTPQQPVTTQAATPIKAPGHAAPAPTAEPVRNTPAPTAIPAPTPTPRAAEPALNLPPPEKITETPGTPGKFEVHSGSNGYTIQAGVFLHAANADKLLTQLQGAGVPAWLETRVQIGPFKNKADAEAAIRKLRKLGIEPVVRENQ